MMKSTLTVRKIDNLGRIVLPKSLRKALEINEGDPLEILVDGQDIVLRKYERGCCICGTVGVMSEFKGKEICISCRNELRK